MGHEGFYFGTSRLWRSRSSYCLKISWLVWDRNTSLKTTLTSKELILAFQLATMSSGVVNSIPLDKRLTIFQRLSYVTAFMRKRLS